MKHESVGWGSANMKALAGMIFFAIGLGNSVSAQALNLETAPEQLFRIQGSNTIGAVVGPALVKSFFEEQGCSSVLIEEVKDNEQQVVCRLVNARQIRVDVKSYGSSSGFRALANNKADIVASSRPIKVTEHQQLLGFGDLRDPQAEQILGIDALAIVVHPDNSVPTITTAELQGIFTGDITNWKQLGGADLPIAPYARDEDSGTWDTFKKLVLGGKDILSKGTARFDENASLSQAVGADRGGIGFSSLNTTGGNRVVSVSAGGIRALAPARLSVATEDYPLSRRLFMYLPQTAKNPYAEEFMSFVLSDKGQAIVGDSGYISQTVEPVEPDLDRAPEFYVETVAGMKQLTVNFRFREGKAVLDNKAHQDVRRLKDFLNKNPGKLTLIGFAGERGSRDKSELFSRLRSKVVFRELMRSGIERGRVDHLGLGAYMPLGTEQDALAKVRNRRVEVWYQPST